MFTCRPSESLKTMDDSLNAALQSFLINEVLIEESEYERSITIIEIVDNALETFFKGDIKNELGLRFNEVVLTGSVPEDLKVRYADQFDLMVSFNLGSIEDKWTISELSGTNLSFVPFEVFRTENNETSAKTPLLKLLKRSNGYDFVTPEEFYVLMRNLILRALQGINEDPLKLNWTAEESNGGPAVKINFKDPIERKRDILINIVPTLNVSQYEIKGWLWSETTKIDTALVPKGKDGFWRKSYSTEELTKVNGLVERLVYFLKVLKTLAYPGSGSPLAKLDSYFYKNFVLNICEIDFKTSDDLSRDFKRLMILLAEQLRSKRIPQYFNKNHNLLKHVDYSTITTVSRYLSDVIENDDYEDLLDANRSRVPKIDHYTEVEKVLKEFHNRAMAVDKSKLATEYEKTESILSKYLQQYFSGNDVLQRTKLTFLEASPKDVLPDGLRLRFDRKLKPELYLLFEVDANIWKPCDFRIYCRKVYCCRRKDPSRGNSQAALYGCSTKLDFDAEKFHAVIRQEILSAFNSRSEFENFRIKVIPSKGEFTRIDLLLNPGGKPDMETLRLRLIPALRYIDPSLTLISHGNFINSQYWSECYDLVFRDFANIMDEEDCGIRREVLEIILAIASVTPIGKLKSEMFLFLISNCDNFHGWSEGNVAKMVSTIMRQLSDWVESINIRVPCVTFRGGCDLIKAYDPNTLEKISNYLENYKLADRFNLDLLLSKINNESL